MMGLFKLLFLKVVNRSGWLVFLFSMWLLLVVAVLVMANRGIMVDALGM
jgi:hypothetical protein